MQSSPQILLSRGIKLEQPVVIVGFLFRWDIVKRTKKIPGAAFNTENNLKNFINPLDDLL
jgi:hypothetical protein